MRIRERFTKVLVNPTCNEIVERDPLIAFSHYLSGRVHVLIQGYFILKIDLSCFKLKPQRRWA